MSKQKQNKNNFCTQLVVNLYFWGNSMNNLLSYCGLIDARMRASIKELPVTFGCNLSRYFLMTLNSLNTFQDLGVDLAPLVIQAVMEFLVLVWTLLQGNIILLIEFSQIDFFNKLKHVLLLFFAYLIYFYSKTNWCPHSISSEVNLTILISSHYFF